MVSLHSNKTLAKTEVGAKDLGITVIGLIMLLFGGMWTLELWITKAIEHFRWGLLSHSGRNKEDSGTKGDFNCGGLAQGVSEDRNFNLWPRDYFCDILAKKVAAFSCCPKVCLGLK